MTELVILFAEFFKTGLFAVGGGLATLPFLYKMAENHTWFTAAELADMIAVAESTPGPIGVNMATYAGIGSGGIIGGIIATAGLVIPSVIVILIVAKMLDKFNSSKTVKNAFEGLRPAVIGLIAAAGVELMRVTLLSIADYAAEGFIGIFNIKAIILFVLILAAVLKFKKLHPILFIGIGALCGIIFGGI